MWYTVEPNMAQRLYPKFAKLLSVTLQGVLEAFQETSFMIRKPALDIMNYVKKSNLSYPVNKYILCILLIYID